MIERGNPERSKTRFQVCWLCQDHDDFFHPVVVKDITFRLCSQCFSKSDDELTVKLRSHLDA